MKPLPNLLRKMPYLLYAAAALFFVWYLVNSYFGLTLGAGPYVDPSMSGYINLQKSSALYSATVEAVYLVGCAATLHVLVAIYDRIAASKGDAE